MVGVVYLGLPEAVPVLFFSLVVNPKFQIALGNLDLPNW